eukprot:365141-Chlamydomonas_euryale.AAC.2
MRGDYGPPFADPSPRALGPESDAELTRKLIRALLRARAAREGADGCGAGVSRPRADCASTPLPTPGLIRAASRTTRIELTELSLADHADRPRTSVAIRGRASESTFRKAPWVDRPIKCTHRRRAGQPPRPKAPPGAGCAADRAAAEGGRGSGRGSGTQCSLRGGAEGSRQLPKRAGSGAR